MNAVVTGLDIGNGYVKGSYMGLNGKQEKIDIPACTAFIPNPVDVPVAADDDVIADLFNRMEVMIDSPLVKDKTRRLFGRAGINSNKTLERFNIDSTKSKAEQELSPVLVLGCIAGSAVKNYWAEHHQLPNTMLDAEACVALALPIDEYKLHRENFAAQFKNNTHEVTIYTFENPVHIRITFSSVMVMPEGASAQFAITEKGAPLMQAMMQDVRTHGVMLEELTEHDILSAENTVGIDIGEGTVNFPVFTDKRFNTVASLTLGKGFGSVLDSSLAPLKQKDITYENRKTLADFIQKPVKPITKRRHQTVNDVITSEAKGLAQEIVFYFSKIMSSGQIEVAYVYGGGATPMKEALYDLLLEESKKFSGGDDFPIMYLDSKYARNLNREGLYSVAMKNYEAMVQTQQA